MTILQTYRWWTDAFYPFYLEFWKKRYLAHLMKDREISLCPLLQKPSWRNSHWQVRRKYKREIWKYFPLFWAQNIIFQFIMTLVPSWILIIIGRSSHGRIPKLLHHSICCLTIDSSSVPYLVKGKDIKRSVESQWYAQIIYFF